MKTSKDVNARSVFISFLFLTTVCLVLECKSISAEISNHKNTNNVNDANHGRGLLTGLLNHVVGLLGISPAGGTTSATPAPEHDKVEEASTTEKEKESSKDILHQGNSEEDTKRKRQSDASGSPPQQKTLPILGQLKGALSLGKENGTVGNVTVEAKQKALLVLMLILQAAQVANENKNATTPNSKTPVTYSSSLQANDNEIAKGAPTKGAPAPAAKKPKKALLGLG